MILRKNGILSMVRVLRYNFRKNEINMIKKYARQGEIQKYDDWFNMKIYNSLDAPSKLLQIYRHKNPLDFYLRNYQHLITNIQNEINIHQMTQTTNPEIEYYLKGQKMLVLALYDHEKLGQLLSQMQQQGYSQYCEQSVHDICQLIRGCSYLVVGRIHKGTQQLLKLANKGIFNNQIYEIALISLLTMHLYSSDKDKDKVSNKPINLYKKIKKNETITQQDLHLGQQNNYLQFINMLLSHKYDTPVQWDQPQYHTQLLKYHKLLYLIAQNTYINNRPALTQQILNTFDHHNPLHQFLTLTQLYDNKQYTRVMQKGRQFVREQGSSYCNLPQYDVVRLNIYRLLLKAQGNVGVGEQQVGQLQEQAQVYRSMYNINEAGQNTHISQHYFVLPYSILFNHKSYVSLFS